MREALSLGWGGFEGWGGGLRGGQPASKGALNCGQAGHRCERRPVPCTLPDLTVHAPYTRPCRGALALEVELTTAHTDVHSGGPGGLPCWQAYITLCSLHASVLSSLCVRFGLQHPCMLRRALRAALLFQLTSRRPGPPLGFTTAGMAGGAVQNPARALAQLLSTMWHPGNHSVAIQGFYDRVRPITDADR